MRIGKYLFENVDFMEEEELDALAEAVNLRKEHIEKRKMYLNKIKILIEKMKNDGYQLVFSNDDLWVNLSCENNLKNICLEDKEDWV